MEQHPVFLWGFMGSGKSRLGKRLAKSLQFQFIDLDKWIEQKENQSITELFETKGEIAFRKLEAEAVQTVSNLRNTLISCGGGTPCFGTNKSIMLQRGVVVFLYAEEDILLDRLWRNKESRPLIATMETTDELSTLIHEKLSERMPYYAQADICYNNTYPRSNLSNLTESIQQLLLHKF